MPTTKIIPKEESTKFCYIWSHCSLHSQVMFQLRNRFATFAKWYFDVNYKNILPRFSAGNGVELTQKCISVVMINTGQIPSAQYMKNINNNLLMLPKPMICIVAYKLRTRDLDNFWVFIWQNFEYTMAKNNAIRQIFVVANWQKYWKTI